MAAARPRKRTAKSPDDARIVEAALALAGESGWYDFSMTDLANLLGIPRNELLARFRDSDAIANAWFGSASDAMLQPTPRRFALLEPKERLAVLIWRWFDALAPHRRVTAEMLRTKLHLPHVHHWLPMVFDLSRLVQAWRDAAGLRAGGRRRQLEEVGLSALFLATLAVWCNDESEEQQRTRDFLERRLAEADKLLARLTPCNDD